MHGARISACELIRLFRIRALIRSLHIETKLGKLKLAKSEAALVQALDDADPDVRKSVRIALAQINAGA
jgi:hypothetical protein